MYLCHAGFHFLKVGDFLVISLFFGLPGTGKTTILAKHAKDYLDKKIYKTVYSNIPLQIPGVVPIDNSDIGKFDISDGVLLIDEGTLFADSRDFKAFGADRLYYFMMHRHFHIDIEIFLQQWDALDRKIRCITDKVYYVHKGGLLRRWVTKYYKIPYDIIIPDGKSESQKLGEIIQGYCKPPLLVRLFCPRVWRPKYYKYFDSWSHKDLPPLPDRCVPFPVDSEPGDFSKVKFCFLWFFEKLRFLKNRSPRRLIRGAINTSELKAGDSLDGVSSGSGGSGSESDSD